MNFGNDYDINEDIVKMLKEGNQAALKKKLNDSFFFYLWRPR